MDDFNVYSDYIHKCLVNFIFGFKCYIETNIVLS